MAAQGQHLLETAALVRDLMCPVEAHTLRPYQEAAITELHEKLKDNPVLVAPTGSGKTVMLSAYLRRHNLRPLWIAHRKELVDQAVTHLERHGLECGRIKAGHDPNPDAFAQVASIQTLVRREWPSNIDVVVVDEAHHVKGDGMYERLFDRGVPVIGATATPFRLDGKGLNDFFHEMVISATARELVEAGFLVAPKIFSHPSPNLKGVHSVGGDYNLGELSERVNVTVLLANIVETWKKHREALGRPLKTVAFAVTCEHSRGIVETFRAAGVAAEHLDGTFADDEREAVLRRLASGETQVLCQVGIVSEGFDLPDLECAIMARPTKSLCWWLQACGRIMRPKASALILDHSGNALEHGSPVRDIDYSLDGYDKKQRESASTAAKVCPNCHILLPLSATVCPECGYSLVSRREIQVVDGELKEYLDPLAQAAAFPFEERRDFFERMERQRVSRNYKPGFTAARYKDKFGGWPLVAVDERGARRLIEVTTASIGDKRDVYRELLAFSRARGYKDGFASYRYRDAFGSWPSGFVTAVKMEVHR